MKRYRGVVLLVMMQEVQQLIPACMVKLTVDRSTLTVSWTLVLSECKVLHTACVARGACPGRVW